MEELDQTNIGGTMRLGLKKTYLDKNLSTIVYKLYGKEVIEERHRHRYEVNPSYIHMIDNKTNLRFVGRNGPRMEVVEVVNHPFMVGCQYHPEFKTYPNRPHPLFVGLLRACMNKRTT